MNRLTRDFPNCFIVSTIQSALAPNFPHLLIEQADHIAHIVRRCLASGCDTVEPTAAGEAEWTATIMKAGVFRKAYQDEPQPLTSRNYGRAIAAYEATLTTPAAFDRFLAGDDSALTERQKSGMRAFVASGCGGCHSGPLLGGTLMQRFGVVRNYWIETGSTKINAPKGRAYEKSFHRVSRTVASRA